MFQSNNPNALIKNHYCHSCPFTHHNIMIEDYYYLKILKLTKQNFVDGGGIHIHASFKDYDQLIFNYIMDNLHQFHGQDDYDSCEMLDQNIFYWDVTNDPLIPYLVGLTPKTFKPYLDSLHGPIHSVFIELKCDYYFHTKEIVWGMMMLEIIPEKTLWKNQFSCQ